MREKVRLRLGEKLPTPTRKAQRPTRASSAEGILPSYSDRRTCPTLQET
jgi:hypothetical protein